MEIVREIAGYFCKNTRESKPVVAVADYGESKEYFRSANRYFEYFQEDSRIMAIADGYSASATEVLLGCMIDYGCLKYEDICLSDRMGSAKTYGKGIMQTTFPLFGKSGAIKLTTAHLKWPVSGNCIHGRGILPEDGTKTISGNYAFDAEIQEAIAKFFN